ncbi:MAG: alpha/beta fold hydrolase [Sulfitobacter sp.]|nr:alpha/beta fold hydrolase [Sulfitobacter sp.]
MLNFLEQGQARPDTPPLVIAHGLFGSARNWNVIAKRMSDRGRVIVPDLRNHGDSPHHPTHSYADLAADLAQLIRAEAQGPVDLCGHSMGGKAAMALALTEPDLVRRLVVADIAPVKYSHSQAPMIEAMRKVDLTTVTRRSEAAEQLGAAGVEPALQSFFTQSLDLANRRWLLNLDTLESEMPRIMDWPETLTGPYQGPTLFLSGGASDYVGREHRATIKALFPAARFAKIPGAGHWLHAERPRDFEAALRAFLDAA